MKNIFIPFLSILLLTSCKNSDIDKLLGTDISAIPTPPSSHLQILPSSKTLSTLSSFPFSASGGATPYVFSVSSGGGSFVDNVYTAPVSAGTATVRVTDSRGNISEALVTIASGLTISPTTKALAVNNTFTFTASGGLAPYSFSIAAGSGTINSSSGLYTAPASAGSASIRVTDSLGNTSDALVTINGALTISPSSKSIAINNSFALSASGGVSPYTYTVFSGGGSISGSTYTAPNSAGSATVRVTDSLGNTSDSAVIINAALAISPSSKTLAINNTFTFTATGGVSPYTYSIPAGGGTISGSTYTAPNSVGSATVRVTDSLGNTSDSAVTINAALAISPSTKTLAVNNTYTFTASGGLAPYSYTIASGSGSINLGSGLYTAPASAGSATVRVTDTLGNVSDALVTINAALTISPSSKSIAINNSFALSASGGVSPYTYTVLSGGGSISGSTYTAPNSAGSATVRVTDSLGNTSDSSVTITAGLSIDSPTKTLVVNNSYTFSATGGVSPYSYSIPAGGGTISGSTYTAPNSAGSATVRVTDSLGNTSDSAVTINSALAISPSTKTLAVNNTFTFTASGGLAPYSFSIAAGSGTIDSSSGLYTAPASFGASSTVRVTDSLGNTSDALVTINGALTISPSSKSIAINNSFALSAIGGLSPYTFTVFSGGGSISGSTYTAPNSAGSATARVTDALGNTSDCPVTITAGLTIDSPTKTLAVNNSYTFSATGGVSPYTYSITAGGGTIGSTTGTYTAPNSAGSATVRVTDSLGNTSDSAVTINSALGISPATKTLAVNNTFTFTASGGLAPYVFTVNTGSGSIDTSTGLYTAPGSAGSATVRVTDALNNTSDALVTINAALAISPSSKSIAINNSFALSASGGVSPYTYTVLSGGGSISGSTYTAPNSAGSATVRVTDSLGNTSDSSVTINAALAISPSSKTLAINNTFTFSATGGVSPYTYTVLSGGGSISGSTYTAPNSAGSATVRVTDSLGNTSDSAVTINAALAISPGTKSLAVNNTFTFTASGGLAPYSYTIASGSGSINLGSGLYTAPASAGSASVRVTDSLGNVSDALVTINSVLAISPSSKTLAINNTFTFSATGGVSPYTYTVFSGGGSISGSTYTAPNSAGSATVRVTDSLGNTSDSSVTITAGLSIDSPTKTLAVNNSYTFSATGGVSPYSYSIPAGGGTISGSTYTAPNSAGSATVRVTDSLGNTSDSAVTINSALAISPSAKTLAVSNTFTFTASGGLAPYVYSVNSGSGTIDSSSGLFTAPASAGSATVRVTDALNNTSDALITINSSLTISPATKSIAIGNNFTLTATGGVSPYVYSLQSGSGTLVGAVYTAPGSAGSATVRVTDALSNTSDCVVTITAGLTIDSPTKTLAVNNNYTFSATGGVSPYTFSIPSGGGTIGASTGIYTAPNAAGSATVRVTDSLGNTSNSAVTINAVLAISPTTKTLAVNNTFNYTATTGGVPPYNYSVPFGVGSFSGTTYTAPASSGTATIRVTDSLGNTSDGSMTINAALAISPTSKTMAINTTLALSATGGVTPYSYTVVSGGGSITGSTYTAPGSAGSATLRVTDNVGNTSDCAVTISAALAISPATMTLAVNNTFTFSATGGVGSNTYSVIAGTGTINSSTGLYTAPASSGSATVRVTDSDGNTSDASVTINAALQISPTTKTIVISTNGSFSATGGVSPYTYSVASGGGSVSGTTYTAPGSTGLATVRVTDSLGNTSDSAVTISAVLSLSPAAPSVVINNSKTFIGAGGVPPYIYSVTAGSGSINSSSGVFTAPGSTGSSTITVTDSVNSTATASVTTINVTQIAFGTNNVCAVMSDNTVRCWGLNTSDLVFGGGSTLYNSTIPVTIPGLTSVTQVELGNAFGCALITGGTVKCWGTGTSGQLGNGLSVNSSYPVTVSGISTATQISVGQTFACARLSGSTIKCWGLGTTGQLGDGNGTTSSSPVTVSGIANATSVSSGYQHSCANLSDNTVKCWGLGTSGQLGNSASSTSNSPVVVTGINTAIQVSAGSLHSCATLSGGTIQCWGRGTEGQLGNSASLTSNVAVTVTGITTATSVVANGVYGNGHSCAVLSGGTAKCWGMGSSGEIGDGTTTSLYNSPQSVTGISTASTFAHGSSHETATCLLLTDGTVKCWGANTYGEIGNGVAVNSTIPVAVSGISTATQVSIGGNHACAILSGGSVKCWGYGASGQLGNGSNSNSTVPVTVSGIANATQIVSQFQTSCALLSDKSIKCWGYGSAGLLGNGGTANSNTPVAVSGISTATQIAMAGGSGTTRGTACALLQDQTIKCWGSGSYGTVGNGANTATNSSPVAVSGISTATSIGAGADFAMCAILSDQSEKCWGDNNSGQLGNQSVTASNVPVTVIGLGGNPTQISGGDFTNCALLSDGTVQCWGATYGGGLSPGYIVGLSNVSQIAGGSASYCALLSTGDVKCFGGNSLGQLGNGTVTNSVPPVKVLNLSSTVTQITGNNQSVGDNVFHFCALLNTGAIQCWGSDSYGELGDGSNSPYTSPTTVVFP